MRVILADDAVLFREGVARVLAEAGFDVVAQASDAEGLLELAAREKPDVVIVDIRMPPSHTTEGLEAARQLGSELPEVGVLLLSQYLEPHYAMKLVSELPPGVGYLLKDRVSDLDGFADAVRRVARGETVVDPGVVSQLLARQREDDRLHDLTEREREVLGLMAEGSSNQAISERLFVTPRTVEAHVGSIFTKLRLEPAPDQHRRVLAVLAYLRS